MKFCIVFLWLSFLTACIGTTATSVPREERIGSLPLTIKHPINNPTTAEKVELGRLLFWDPILSGDQDVACVTCHHPDAGYADGLDVSIGVGGQGLAEQRKFGVFALRNAPTIINTGFNGINVEGDYDPENTSMFWDNRGISLEDQALGPIHSKEEMRGENFTDAEIMNVVVQRLEGNALYVDLFNQAFGSEVIDATRISQAIASFERTLVNNNTPFDQFARGDSGALDKQEIRGLNLFIESGCTNCHSGPMLSDYELHALPVSINDKQVSDKGIEGKFRTPSLRNLAMTAPYMHNGTEVDLISAISFYDNIENPTNDPKLDGVDLSDDEGAVEAIEAFLLTLSDSNFDQTIPSSVPSGLNPGGDI